MVKPAKFAHVVYQTRRYDEMLAWYRKVFEAEVVHRDPALAFLTYDDEHHRFAFANLNLLKPDGEDPDDRGTIGVNHVAYTYADLGALLETYIRLKDAGITPYWSIHHGITMSNYYRDPDGNRMEFQIDVEDNYMASDLFAANPVGVDIDMDTLVARWRAGDDPLDLIRMPDGPMAPIPALHGMT